MFRIKFRLAALCAAAVVTTGAVQAAEVSVAAISGYFAQGFGQSIVAGLDKAKADFGVEVKLIDTGNRALDYEEQFNNVAKDGQYDLVFVMGWELVDALVKTAEAYPNQRFVFIDGVLDSDKIVYADFSEEEGSFVTGAFAGLMADKGSAIEGLGDGKAIGFVGGRDIPVIRNFLRGYEQGAKAAAPDVRVDAVFAGTFDDPAKGSELTMALYGQGDDIVYNVAGPTGEGVLQASAAAGKYSIGVDIDQCGVAPGHVMASMLKRGDIAVYTLIKDEVEGRTVKPGTYTFDLKSGGVELLMCPDVADMIPEDVKARVAELRQGVIDGSIKITE
jgi:basic membrane protein A